MNVEQVSISITKEQLSQLPVVSYPGKIQVINTDSEAVDAFKQILMSKTVGIDTETRPSFKKGHINSVALIQIATDPLLLSFPHKQIRAYTMPGRFFTKYPYNKNRTVTPWRLSRTAPSGPIRATGIYRPADICKKLFYNRCLTTKNIRHNLPDNAYQNTSGCQTGKPTPLRRSNNNMRQLMPGHAYKYITTLKPANSTPATSPYISTTG